MSYIFNAIVSVVVGGVLLTGGFGSVIGIFFGTLTFAVVNQGIYFTNIDRNWSSLIIGMMLLLAVVMNNLFRKMALTYSPRTKVVRTAQ
jgi:simple sugar transport system permease protein